MVNCINNLAFIFSKAKTIIKCDNKQKYCDICACNPSNTYETYVQVCKPKAVGNNYCKKCCNVCEVSGNNYKLCIFKLCKSNFISSTLNISFDFDSAWQTFVENVGKLINAYFVISVSKCDELHSFNAKLIKVKNCSCCDAMVLYFKYNFIPFNYSTPTLPNYTTYETKEFKNGCGTCIPITYYSNIPQSACTPPNYWPVPKKDIANKPCANIIGNFAYDNLKCTTYYDIKFYYNDKYCENICFASII